MFGFHSLLNPTERYLFNPALGSFFKVFHVLGKITLNCHEKFNIKKFEALVLIPERVGIIHFVMKVN